MRETTRYWTDYKMYTEFGKIYPKMKKDRYTWRHFLYDEIIIIFKDGRKGIYNRKEKRFRYPTEWDKRLIDGL